MTSLYEELSANLDRDPSLTKRGGPRYDLGLLLFDFRDPLHALWRAAAAEVERAQLHDREPSAALAEALDALHPLFGERQGAR